MKRARLIITNKEENITASSAIRFDSKKYLRIKESCKKWVCSCLFTALLIYGPILKAQQVIATSGNFGSNSNGSISWTMGEVAIQTFACNQVSITQGFHQPQITVVIINTLPELDYLVSVFPNPTKEMVKLKVENAVLEKMQYLLYDSNGKLLVQKDVQSTETVIPFNTYSVATYILKVTNYKKEVKTFKIIKE